MGRLTSTIWQELVLLLSVSLCVSSQPAQSPTTTPRADAGNAELPPCSEAIESGLRRPGTSTFRILNTTTAELCCEECRSVPSCRSWNRKRSTMVCALKLDVPDLVDGADDFDSGVVGGAAVPDEIPDEFPCPTELGKSRSDGSSVRTSTESSSDDCCMVCDNEPVCISWTFENATGRCDLHSQLYDAIDAPGFDTGLVI